MYDTNNAKRWYICTYIRLCDEILSHIISYYIKLVRRTLLVITTSPTANHVVEFPSP